MSGTQSSARQAAELAFSHLQFPASTKTRAQEEREIEIAERAEKSRRLRAARLERDEAEMHAAAKLALRNSAAPAF